MVILGSTGSIGTSCLKVIQHLPDRFETYGLSAHSRWQELIEQAFRYEPRYIAITDGRVASDMLGQTMPPGTRMLNGEDAVAKLVTDPAVDIVLTAIVGAAGLKGTWLALDAGKTVAVANKETLVMAGPQVI